MSELAAKPDTAPRGQHLLGALALHPALARPFLIFSEYIATASSLSARDRELIILRISWLHRSEYEFMQHLILARGDRKSTRLNSKSLMRISYAVFCLKKKKNKNK